jgi:hypothetical protein
MRSAIRKHFGVLLWFFGCDPVILAELHSLRLLVLFLSTNLIGYDDDMLLNYIACDVWD